MTTQDKINALVARRHPDYNEMVEHWDFLGQTYEGGRKWFSQHIFKYFKEGSGEYKDRISRAYRFNHTREVVDLINKYLYRRQPDRKIEDAPLVVQEFWKNVDGSGMDIKEFVRTASQKASIYGCPWVVVDTSAVNIPENASIEDVQDARIYAYIVRPDQVCDMSWGEDGELNWILIKESYRDDEDPLNSTGKVLSQYRLWTRDSWHLYRPKSAKQDSANVHVGSNASVDKAVNAQDFELHQEGSHGAGVVPAIRLENTPSDHPWVVPALINDIAYLDRAVANYLSNLDAIIQDQTFSQLAIPAQNLMPGDDAYKKVIEAGTNRIFVFDGENGQKPFFLSPDPRQAELIIVAIQQVINEIYHSVGLAGERTKQDNAKGIDNSSGVAKAKDFERVNSLLLSKAQAMESFENKLVKMVARFGGVADRITEDNPLVIYPESFDTVGLFDEFDVAMKLSLIEAPAVMRARQMGLLSRKLFRDASNSELAEIEREIGAWRKRLEESDSLSMEMQRGSLSESKNRLVEEAKRDREDAGRKQSGTKARQENRRKESDRETGRGE